MRTTLSIDDDVLMAARELAARERRSLGEVISEIARRGLLGDTVAEGGSRHGFPVLPHRGGVVTNELIDQIRDEEGI